MQIHFVEMSTRQERFNSNINVVVMSLVKYVLELSILYFYYCNYFVFKNFIYKIHVVEISTQDSIQILMLATECVAK